MSKDSVIYPCRIFLDPFQCALNIEYYIYESNHDRKFKSEEKTTASDKKVAKIWLSDLKRATDIKKLAVKIVKKCPYIPDEWIDDVEMLITELHSRHFCTSNDITKDQNKCNGSNKNPITEANMKEIDQYIEYLYSTEEEDLFDKIHGVTKILYLCKDIDNLEVIIQNRQLMCALSRLLNGDDSKRSMTLCFHLCQIFLAFSNFRELHVLLLSEYRVGSTIMSILELELRRRTRNISRLSSSPDKVTVSSSVSKEENNINTSSSMIVEKDKDKGHPPKNDTKCISNKYVKRQDNIIFTSVRLLMNLCEDDTVERKMIKKKLLSLLCQVLVLHDRSTKSKGCCILALTFFQKLTLYEENTLQLLVHQPHVISHFLSILNIEENVDITISVARVLYNLSFTPKFLESHDVHVSLRLVKQLVHRLLSQSTTRTAVSIKFILSRLLYNLSCHSHIRPHFRSQPDLAKGIWQLIIESQHCNDKRLVQIFSALAVNLSLLPECAIVMIQHKDFHLILPQIVAQKNILLAKVVRNLSYFTHALHQQQQVDDNHDKSFNNWQDNGNDDSAETIQPISLENIKLWQGHISTIIQMILNSYNNDNNDDELLIELFFILSKMTKHDFPSTMFWNDLLLQYSSLHHVMIHKLRSCTLEYSYDIVFSIINALLQICTSDQKCITYLSTKHSDILLVLYNVLKYCKKHDFVENGLTLQILVLLHCFLHESEASDILLSNPVILDDLCSYTNNQYDEKIKIMANECLDVIVDTMHFMEENDNGIFDYSKKILEKRFLAHNEAWFHEVCQ